MLRAQGDSPGYLFRTKAYAGGIDGCVDDVLTLTRPWDFDVISIRVPAILLALRTTSTGLMVEDEGVNRWAAEPLRSQLATPPPRRRSRC